MPGSFPVRRPRPPRACAGDARPSRQRQRAESAAGLQDERATNEVNRVLVNGIGMFRSILLTDRVGVRVSSYERWPASSPRDAPGPLRVERCRRQCAESAASLSQRCIAFLAAVVVAEDQSSSGVRRAARREPEEHGELPVRDRTASTHGSPAHDRPRRTEGRSATRAPAAACSKSAADRAQVRSGKSKSWSCGFSAFRLMNVYRLRRWWSSAEALGVGYRGL